MSEPHFNTRTRQQDFRALVYEEDESVLENEKEYEFSNGKVFERGARENRGSYGE